MAGDVASVKTALAMHGRASTCCCRDVRQVRGEVAEINRWLDRMEQDIATILAAVAPGSPPPA